MKKKTAIDMGASTIRVLAWGSDEVACCPATAALECRSGKPLSYGYEAGLGAKRMPGSVDLVYPLQEPASVTSTVLEGLFGCAAELAHPSGRFHTDLVLSIPGSISEEQESAYPEAASAMGARDVYLVSALHAVSRGIRHAGRGHTALMHLGSSVSEIGIFSGETCLIERTVAVGGRTFDDLLGDYIYDRFGLLLDTEGAEAVKLALCALPESEEKLEATGVNRRTGLPRTHLLDANALRATVRGAFPYLIAPLDELIAQSGEAPSLLVLTGGGAAMSGLREALAEHLPSTEVIIAPEPELAVIRGLQAMIEQKEI